MNKHIHVTKWGNKMPITNVITLAQYANKHGLDVKRLRRIARKRMWPIDPIPFKFGGDTGGIWVIDADALAITLLAKSRRGKRRPDGRQRFVVYANIVERDAIANIVGDDNIVDPRVAAKRRRDARAAAAAAIGMRADAERERLEHDDNE